MAFKTEPVRKLCMEYDISQQFSAPHEYGQLGHVKKEISHSIYANDESTGTKPLTPSMGHGLSRL